MASEVLSCHRHTVVVSSWCTPYPLSGPQLLSVTERVESVVSGREWLFGNHSEERIKLVSPPVSGALSSVTILDPTLALHRRHFPS